LSVFLCAHRHRPAGLDYAALAAKYGRVPAGPPVNDATHGPWEQYQIKLPDQNYDSREMWAALAVALVLPAIVYLLGFSVAWVRRGFRGQ
jgi:hypothetical protein